LSFLPLTPLRTATGHAAASRGPQSFLDAGNGHSQDFTMTKNIPGTRTNPEGIPQEGHGGSNTRGTQAQQGNDGNGAQKRQQEKKS
jgi:hypothetical protein